MAQIFSADAVSEELATAHPTLRGKWKDMTWLGDWSVKSVHYKVGERTLAMATDEGEVRLRINDDWEEVDGEELADLWVETGYDNSLSLLAFAKAFCETAIVKYQLEEENQR